MDTKFYFGISSGAIVTATLSVSIAAPAFASTFPTLSYGSHGNYVRQLQDDLNADGYHPGAADGVFGRGTLSAVKAFQKVHHLATDGVVGAQTWNALTKSFKPAVKPQKAPPPKTTKSESSSKSSSKSTAKKPAGLPTISYGARGSYVKELQTDLNKLGYRVGTVDGIFGPITRSKVESFQRPTTYPPTVSSTRILGRR